MDDQYPIHRKVAGLSDAAFRLHSAAIFWCARNGTDGLVPEEDLDQVCGQVRDPARFAAECVDRRTWHPAAYDCPSPDCPGPRDEKGWVIHDYLQYQPTKGETAVKRQAEQEKKSAGGKLGNHRRWHAAAGKTSPDCPWCLPSVPDRSDAEAMGGPIGERSPGRPSDSSRERASPAQTSDTDRIPIGGSDRSSIAPIPIPIPISGSVGDQSADRNARGDPETDEILKTIIEAIYDRTDRVITAAWAAKIRDHILGNYRAANPVAYVRAVIEKDPDPRTRFLEH